MEETAETMQPDKNLIELHVTFYADYFQQLGLWDFPISQKTLGAQEDFNFATGMTRPVLQALQANFYGAEGNYLAARKLLTKALQHSEIRYFRNPTSNKADVLAYVLFEWGIFQVRLEQPESALAYLEQAGELAQSGPFKAIIDYKIQVLAVTPRKKAAYAKLEQRVIDLRELNLTAVTVLGLHQLGVLADQADQPKVATAYYANALELAKTRGYEYLVWRIQSSQGYSAILQKHYDRARDILDKIANGAPSPHLKALAWENLALIFFNQQQYPPAADLVERALELVRTTGVNSRIAPQCLFLGNLYTESLGEDEKAAYYYQIGFEQVIKQSDAGLPLTGVRAKVIQEYVTFMQTRGSESQTYLPNQAHFEFALGKKWREIMDLFHYNLVIFHFSHTGRGRGLIAHLDMPVTTFYSLKDRLSKRGFKFPRKRDKNFEFNPDHYQDGVQNYLQFQADKTWKEINKIFEKDMMEFLYASYGYKKTRLSEILDLSYPMVIAKTKAVTDEDNQYNTYKRK